MKNHITNYYENFRLRVTSRNMSSDWHQHEEGIIIGCTISVILFTLTMKIVVKALHPYLMFGNPHQSLYRQPHSQHVIGTWWEMASLGPGKAHLLNKDNFKACQMHSHGVEEGEVVDKFHFYLDATAIPSIVKKPVKSLGKTFDCSGMQMQSKQSTRSLRFVSPE